MRKFGRWSPDRGEERMKNSSRFAFLCSEFACSFLWRQDDDEQDKTHLVDCSKRSHDKTETSFVRDAVFVQSNSLTGTRDSREHDAECDNGNQLSRRAAVQQELKKHAGIASTSVEVPGSSTSRDVDARRDDGKRVNRAQTSAERGKIRGMKDKTACCIIMRSNFKLLAFWTAVCRFGRLWNEGFSRERATTKQKTESNWKVGK